jgi:cystathionine gamma-synthase
VSLHSATKFLAGHSDVQLGAIVTNDDELYGVLKSRRDVQGNIPGPFEAWLALRGMRTLHLRVDRAQSNAVELARRLGDHPFLTEVRYPGMGAMISIVLPTADQADLLVRSTSLWVNATSLGGVESTFERRRRWRSEPGSIPEGLVRLSVGIEDVDDLWADLEQALTELHHAG